MIRADESRYATRAESGKPLAALLLERPRAGVGYRALQGLDLRESTGSPRGESLTDHPLERIRLVHPRGEHCHRLTPLGDDEPLTGPNAPQIATEVLPQLPDADTLAHRAKCSTIVATCRPRPESATVRHSAR